VPWEPQGLLVMSDPWDQRASQETRELKALQVMNRVKDDKRVEAYIDSLNILFQFHRI
jgi:hypothetical protein